MCLNQFRCLIIVIEGAGAGGHQVGRGGRGGGGRGGGRGAGRGGLNRPPPKPQVNFQTLQLYKAKITNSIGLKIHLVEFIYIFYAFIVVIISK